MAYPESSLPDVIRALVTVDEAERIDAILRTRPPGDPRPGYVRRVGCMRASFGASLAVQARELQHLLGSPYAHSFGDKRALFDLSSAVLGELRAVLGDRAPTLADLEALHPRGTEPAPDEPMPECATVSAPFDVATDCSYLGAFEVASDALLVGEITGTNQRTEASRSVLVGARRGQWHALLRAPTKRLLRTPTRPQLVVFHHDVHAGVDALASSAKAVATLGCRFAQLHAIDAAMRDDVDFYEQAIFPTLRAGTSERGAWFHSAAPEKVNVRALITNESAVLVTIT